MVLVFGLPQWYGWEIMPLLALVGMIDVFYQIPYYEALRRGDMQKCRHICKEKITAKPIQKSMLYLKRVLITVKIIKALVPRYASKK